MTLEFSPALVMEFIIALRDQNGHRKILGVDFTFEESYRSYKHRFNRIKERGLKKLNLAISYEHKD